MSKALYRIYRPTTFKEVSGQEHVVRTIQNQNAAQTLAHAYLFTGPRGVGKTTTARLLAKLVNCTQVKDNEPCNTCDACESITAGNSLDVFEVDAASHTDVDNVRENIIKSVRFAPNQLNKKVFIIDEVHMLSTSAFNALLKTLEEPPEHALFILATTEIHKVPETIISRCQRFDFKRIGTQEMIKRLKTILKAEKVEVSDDVLEEIVRHSTGCARDAESLLSQVLALGEKKIGMEEASLVLPATNQVLIDEFVSALKEKDAAEGIRKLNSFIDQGVDLRHFVNDVIRSLRDELLETVANGGETGNLNEMLEGLMKAAQSIRGEQIPQLPVELAIVKLCQTSSPPRSSKEVPGEVAKTTKPAPSNVEEQTPTSSRPSEASGEISKDDKQDFNQPGGDLAHPETIKEEAVSKEVVEEATTEEPTESPTALGGAVPVLNLDEVKNSWPKVYEQIKECNATLPMFMQQCEVSSVDGNRVELGFEYELYVQTVNQDKNRIVVEEVVERVLGKPVKIKAVHKKHEVDDTAAMLTAEFGGSIVTP